MPVDASIYQNRTPPDPIAGLGGTVNLANALTQNQILNANNQLTQGNLQGQGQYGLALIDAIGNPVGAMIRLAGPGGDLIPLYAPSGYGNAASLQGAQAGATNLTAAGSQAQSANVYARLNSLAATGNAKNSDYTGVINEAMSSGALPPAVGGGIISRLDPRDPKKTAAFIQNEAAGSVSPTEQSAPAQRGATTSGQPIWGTEAGRQAAARAPGGTVVSPPPGVVGANEATGIQAGQQLAADLRGKRQFHAIKCCRFARRLRGLDPRSGPREPGPEPETRNNIISFAQSMGIPIPNPENVTKYDEANKYLVDFVNQNGNTGTNDKLAAAFSGNPSVHISNAAASDVAKTALALRRIKLAQVSRRLRRRDCQRTNTQIGGLSGILNKTRRHFGSR